MRRRTGLAHLGHKEEDQVNARRPLGEGPGLHKLGIQANKNQDAGTDHKKEDRDDICRPQGGGLC